MHLLQLIRELGNINVKKKEPPFCYPYSFKARVLVLSHLARMEVSEDLEEGRTDQLNYILSLQLVHCSFKFKHSWSFLFAALFVVVQFWKYNFGYCKHTFIKVSGVAEVFENEFLRVPGTKTTPQAAVRLINCRKFKHTEGKVIKNPRHGEISCSHVIYCKSGIHLERSYMFSVFLHQIKDLWWGRVQLFFRRWSTLAVSSPWWLTAEEVHTTMVATPTQHHGASVSFLLEIICAHLLIRL